MMSAAPRDRTMDLYACLHEDETVVWLQLEGGNDDAPPQLVRLLRGAAVVETRRCIAMPLGRKSHARPGGRSSTWAVLRAPDALVAAMDRGPMVDHRVQAFVAGSWVDAAVHDTGCRFGSGRHGARSA